MAGWLHDVVDSAVTSTELDQAFVKLADRIANIEAAKPGDKHIEKYAREHPEFADVVRHHVPGAMWLRYL
jgi:hypothetical protein